MTISKTARFTDLGAGMTSEMIGTNIQITYDPATQAASVNFTGKPYVQINGVYHSIGSNSQSVGANLSDKLAATYGSGTDPVTGADLSKVSIAGLMVIIKAAYNEFCNERADADALSALAVANTVLSQAQATPATNGTGAIFTSTASGLAATFTDMSAPAAGATIVSWSWIFGDGYGSSTLKDPTYTYQAAGTYTVTLVASDSTGAQTVKTGAVTVA